MPIERFILNAKWPICYCGLKEPVNQSCQHLHHKIREILFTSQGDF